MEKIENLFPMIVRMDENGKLVDDLGVVDNEELLDTYREMKFLRAFDERAWNLQRQGVIGTYAPFKGQEAAQMGAARPLEDLDWLVPTYRDWAAGYIRGVPVTHGLFFAKGHPYVGKIPEGTRVLPAQVVIGAQTLHAVGVAWATKLRRERAVTLVTFGDGATSQGDFHEALNFASVMSVPLIFFCENNHWAISVPLERQMRAKTIAQRGLAYDIESYRVDGNDYVAVRNLITELRERVVNGEGPFLVEAVTYRLGAHTTADDPSKYRLNDEEQVWSQRDPIRRIELYLKEAGLLDDHEISVIEQSANARVEEVVKQFEHSLDLGPEILIDHVYAETPDELLNQRDALLARAKEGRH
jgi:pyruvate dehydrogenase E1 component alpha subunit